MKPLGPEDIAIFKEHLELQLDELLLRAEYAVQHLSCDGDSTADFLDRATMDSGREYSLRFRERESRLIRKIKTALRKIEEGTFGICESCGEDIPPPRLQARSVTAHCIKCKTHQEFREKATGI